MIVIYEITAIVREDLSERYEQYMIAEHIPDLMATGAFGAASIGRSEPGRYRIRYEAKSRDHLNTYLRDHAPRLREHALKAFPEGVELSREEWDVVAVFNSAVSANQS